MHRSFSVSLVATVLAAATSAAAQDFTVPDVGPSGCVAFCGGSSSSGSSGGSSVNLPTGFSGTSSLGREFGSGEGAEGFADRSSEGGDGEQEKTLRGLLSTVPEGSTETAAAPLFSGDGGGVVDPSTVSGEFRSSGDAENIVNWVSVDQLPTAEPYVDYSEMGLLQPLKDRVKASVVDLVKSEVAQQIIARIPHGSAFEAIYDEGKSLYDALGEGIVAPMAEKTLGNISDATAYPVTGEGDAAPHSG